MTDPQLPPPPPPSGYIPPSTAPASANIPAPVYPTSPAYPGAAPVPQAPPGAYAAPVGGYAAPSGGYEAAAPAQPKSSATGLVALIMALVAAVVTPIIAGIAGYQIGYNLPTATQYLGESTDDLSFLAPVRDQVLWGELSFWAGTLIGIAAIVFAIIAIAKRRGRGTGIAALIIAIVGPGIFFVVLGLTVGIGASAGVATGL